jgi:hypothetical protein
MTMTIGELLMHESNVRLQNLRQSPGTAGRLLKPFLHWAAWLNYLISVIVLAAGITAGWRFAETGFDLMMKNVTGEEIRQTVIKKIPAWIFVYKGIKGW